MRSKNVRLILSTVSFLSTDLTRDVCGNCFGLILEDFLGPRSLKSLTVELESVAWEMRKKEKWRALIVGRSFNPASCVTERWRRLLRRDMKGHRAQQSDLTQAAACQATPLYQQNWKRCLPEGPFEEDCHISPLWAWGKRDCEGSEWLTEINVQQRSCLQSPPSLHLIFWNHRFIEI